jgi:hypothetical protein
MTIDIDDLSDPRPDHERAADAALGTAVAHAAQQLLREGAAPRLISTSVTCPRRWIAGPARHKGGVAPTRNTNCRRYS